MTQQQLYVIVQAGGRGSRLRHHTWNKPKCLVSVQGKPLLYHLFDRMPQAKFIIIGDYAFEQLEKYLEVNRPRITYELIRTTNKGTASGIADALIKIPADAPVVLTWSDLILGDLPPWPDTNKPVVCITSAFTCRWSITPQKTLEEVPSATNGIPGLFFFPKASLFPTPPASGEFVKWFAANIHDFELLECSDIKELGDFSTIEESNDRAGFCRFFNKVEIGENRVVKTVVDPLYEELHQREIAWYQEARRLGFRRIPKVYSEHPLVLERIKGDHAYQMTDLSERERRAVMADYLDALIALHDSDTIPASPADIKEVYLDKTIARVESVAKIIPGFERESMTINGKKCRNLFASKYRGILETLLPDLQPDHFVPIHGDPTFSNTLIDDKLRVWFIDPRGYFAKPGIMGDAWYDFAKVYYSAVGGYDAFNRRKFKLHIDEETVEILMEEPLFARTAKLIFKDYFGMELSRIEILHGLIWLALSGYAKDDIDSVIGSFYLGLYWLEVGLEKR
ncbi:MAG: NTP transferase domain-containing protein [Campylobacterales bacterium]